MKIIIFLFLALLFIIFFTHNNESSLPINFWYSTTQLNNTMSPETGPEYFYKHYVNGKEFTEQSTGKSAFTDAVLVMQILPGDSVTVTEERINKISEKEFLRRINEKLNKPKIKI